MVAVRKDRHAAFARTEVMEISSRLDRAKAVSPLSLCHRSP